MTLSLQGSSNWDQTAYDRLTYPALRPELFLDSFATVKPTRQSMPGAAVIFSQVADLSVVSTAINESTDVASVALSDTQITVTLAEYGNVAQSSAKLRGTSYVEVDPIVLEVIAYNAGVSIDTIARDTLKAGTNVRYAAATTTPSGRTSIEPEDSFAATTVTGASLIRRSVAELRGANVKPWAGNKYVGIIHPDVSYDLRGATGTSNWRDPRTYSEPSGIFNGEIGDFEGVRFIESPRAPVFADAGSSTTLTDVYRTIILGQEALAKAWSITDGGRPMPTTFPTPPLDNLRRFLGHAWYHLVGYGIFREASIRGLESSSSIGSNS